MASGPCSRSPAESGCQESSGPGPRIAAFACYFHRCQSRPGTGRGDRRNQAGPCAGSIGTGDYIVRTSPNCPSVFVAGGTVAVPYRGKWLAVPSPNVSRVVWRIGFSHLADDEVDPSKARRFFCPECSDGDLVLRQQKGEGWFLVCTNGQRHTCYHRKRLSPTTCDPVRSKGGWRKQTIP